MKNQREGNSQEYQETSEAILVEQKLKNRLKSKNDDINCRENSSSIKDGKLNTLKNKILLIIISSILGILLLIGILYS